MQTMSKSGITKPNPKLCYKAVMDYTYTEFYILNGDTMKNSISNAINYWSKNLTANNCEYNREIERE